MSQQTGTFSEATINKMKAVYAKVLNTAPPGAVFQARINGAVITAYKSGRVLFQGRSASEEFKKWAPMKREIAKGGRTASTKKRKQTTAPFLSTNHIGSDESGTGDYFGPITACAVYVTEKDLLLLKEMNVRDSKTITDATIFEMVNHIKNLNITYSLMILHNERYNELQRRGWTQGKMKAMLHQGVINKVVEKIGDTPYDGILIDQFCERDTFIRHIQSEGMKLHDGTHFMTKAESHSLAVACASIIARASFVQELDQISNRIGVKLPKGASRKVDEVAAEIIRKKGIGYLNSIAKVHFATTNKARELIR